MISNEQILAALIDQRDRLNTAIAAMEGLQSGTAGQLPTTTKRRGRPPAQSSKPEAPSAKEKDGKKTRVISPEGRKRMAAAQQRRWATQRKQAGAGD